MLINSLVHARQGMVSHGKDLRDHGEPIARTASGEPAADLPGHLVGLLTARRGFEANAALARRTDETLGTLIDLLA